MNSTGAALPSRKRFETTGRTRTQIVPQIIPEQPGRRRSWKAFGGQHLIGRRLSKRSVWRKLKKERYINWEGKERICDDI